MRQMHANVCIDLPADEFEEAAGKLKVKPVWDAFLKALLDAKIVHVAKLETIESRAKPVTLASKRRGRPRLQPVPAPPVQDDDPDEAA